MASELPPQPRGSSNDVALSKYENLDYDLFQEQKPTPPTQPSQRRRSVSMDVTHELGNHSQTPMRSDSKTHSPAAQSGQSKLPNTLPSTVESSLLSSVRSSATSSPVLAPSPTSPLSGEKTSAAANAIVDRAKSAPSVFSNFSEGQLANVQPLALLGALTGSVTQMSEENSRLREELAVLKQRSGADSWDKEKRKLLEEKRSLEQQLEKRKQEKRQLFQQVMELQALVKQHKISSDGSSNSEPSASERRLQQQVAEMATLLQQHNITYNAPTDAPPS
mmetsp:Transcript_48709/g.95514  ORF Transcript_48709/g.95514 Transcript_48709/m.95514 type:complete len:277 (+) Transcript_48709:59-889(+)